MELIRGIHNLRSEHHGCVLTIGNFDGVHLGHQAVLAQVKAQARALGVAAAVTFEPQPQEILSPKKHRRDSLIGEKNIYRCAISRSTAI